MFASPNTVFLPRHSILRPMRRGDRGVGRLLPRHREPQAVDNNGSIEPRDWMMVIMSSMRIEI